MITSTIKTGQRHHPYAPYESAHPKDGDNLSISQNHDDESMTSTELLQAVMTVSEIAETYGVNQNTVNQACRMGWLPFRKSGKTLLITRRDAEARWGWRRQGDESQA